MVPNSTDAPRDNTRGWTVTFGPGLSATYSKPRLRVVGASDTEPYASTWRAYHAAGYAPIFLAAGQKHPPPKHEGDVWYIGERSQAATVRKLTEWQNCPKNRHANVAVSFCNTVTVAGTEYQLVGIDVDHYGDKRGGDQLTELVNKLGPLSDRDPWISSSRTDGISGIRWFLVPLYEAHGKRITFGSKADSAIDIVWRGHKYAVVWPSLHPDGGVYWWFPPGVVPNGDGRTAWDGTDGLPVLSEFPILSPSWVAYLTAHRRNDTSGLKIDWDTSNVELLKWAEDTFNDGNADKTCWDIDLAAKTWKRHIDEDASSHDKINDSLWMLYRLAAVGHTGWKAAVDEVVTHWRTGVLDIGKRSPSEAEGEIWRCRLGALRKIKAMIDAGEPVPTACKCAEGGKDIWHSERVPLGVARQLATVFERRDAPLKRWREDWYQHEGRRWRALDSDAFNSLLYRELENAIYLNKNGDRLPWNPTENKVRSVAHALRSVVLRNSDDAAPGWDDERADHVIAFTNTLLRFEDRKQIDHTPNYFNTYALPFAYEPVAPVPQRWLDFLGEVWPDDPESVALLQEWFGYVLSGRMDVHKLLAIFGLRRTGKGTIMHILKTLIGEWNVVNVSADSIAERFGLEPLINTPLAVIDEMVITGSGKNFVAHIKNITGEGYPSVQRKNRQNWDGKLPTRFIFLANEAAHLPDASGTIIDRMLVLETRHNFDHKLDTSLREKLETELPSIFNWALDGLDRLNQRGRFTEPESTREFVGQMYRTSSPITQFIEDYCDFKADAYVSRKTAYDLWKNFCEPNGFESGNINTFLSKLRAAFGDRVTVDSNTKRGPRGQQEHAILGIEWKADKTRAVNQAENGFIPMIVRGQ